MYMSSECFQLISDVFDFFWNLWDFFSAIRKFFFQFSWFLIYFLRVDYARGWGKFESWTHSACKYAFWKVVNMWELPTVQFSQNTMRFELASVISETHMFLCLHTWNTRILPCSYGLYVLNMAPLRVIEGSDRLYTLRRAAMLVKSDNIFQKSQNLKTLWIQYLSTLEWF